MANEIGEITSDEIGGPEEVGFVTSAGSINDDLRLVVGLSKRLCGNEVVSSTVVEMVAVRIEVLTFPTVSR